MRTHVVVVMSLLALSCTALGADVQLKVRTPDGIDYFSYDPSRLDRTDLLRWIQLSPNVDDGNWYSVPEWLEVCIDKAPEYASCGSRDLHDPNFFHNAEVNLERIRSRIRLLEDGKYPPELQPALAYYETIQKTVLQAEEKRLAFLKTWNVADLSGAVGNIDVNQACQAVIGQLKETQDKQAAYQLAEHDLGGCINSAFRKSLGAYPEAAWQQFLQKYSLHERFVPHEAD